MCIYIYILSSYVTLEHIARGGLPRGRPERGHEDVQCVFIE